MVQNKDFLVLSRTKEFTMVAFYGIHGHLTLDHQVLFTSGFNWKPISSEFRENVLHDDNPGSSSSSRLKLPVDSTERVRGRPQLSQQLLCS